MSVLLLSTDLATSSKISAATARAGATFQTAMSVARLYELAAATPARLVLLDLTFVGLTVADAVEQLRTLADPPARIVAFGPHVHEARLAEAQAAGCDVVIARGQFYAQLDRIIESALADGAG